MGLRLTNQVRSTLNALNADSLPPDFENPYNLLYNNKRYKHQTSAVFCTGIIMDKRQVVIRVDDRVRLMSAVLAATNYPEKSQERKKHGTHLHARGTRKVVAEYTHHPAVSAMQILLDQNIPLASMYSYALRLTWPALAGDDTP